MAKPEPVRTTEAAVVTQTTFERVRIWLPEFAFAHMKAQKWVIEDKVFTQCIIEGPAILATTGDVEFIDCNMGLTDEVRSLMYRPLGPKVIGAVAFARTRFVRCHFIGVGFTGGQPFLDQMEKVLTANSGAGAPS